MHIRYRLHTLPLSLSGIFLSYLTAYSRGYKGFYIFLMASLTALFLQILANLANDYGDGIKGTDDVLRVGPKSTIQLGIISLSSMKRILFFWGVLSFITAILLIYFSFKTYLGLIPIFFIFTICACLFAAIKYTIGENAYGYKGWGDLYVFVFFGLISVQGSYFLYTHIFDWGVLLLASAIGLLSVSVLNINNMRDIEGDTKNGKHTLATRIGLEKAKIYHIFLVVSPFILSSIFVRYNQYKSVYIWTFLILIIPIFFHLKRIFSITDSKNFDPEIKKIALLTLFYAFIIGFGQMF